MRQSHNPSGRKRRRTGRRARRFQIIIRLGLLLLAAIGLLKLSLDIKNPAAERREDHSSADTTDDEIDWKGAPEIQVALLTPNEYSRPQITLNKVQGIVIHYTANPGSGAIQNRDYFESLSDGHGTKASSHFVVGLEGEVVQCIPTSEISYASNDRNSDTISIECCHPDETGAFTNETYNSVVALTGWLMHRFGLSEEDVIRHYDVTGNACPLWYVEHEDDWSVLKHDCWEYSKSL